MKQHQRSTFNQTVEILEHSVAYLKDVRDLLSGFQVDEHPERVVMLLESFELAHRKLLGALERYLQDADGRVLETYAQYTVLLPVELGKPHTPLTTLSLMRWLQDLNEPLECMFRELAETANSPGLREAFTALTGLVESHERMLSQEYQHLEGL
ncbi:MAG: hypothetical protein AB7I04_15625 [Pseudomonadales bacterium]